MKGKGKGKSKAEAMADRYMATGRADDPKVDEFLSLLPQEVRILATGIMKSMLSDEQLAPIIGTAMDSGIPTPNIRMVVAGALSMLSALTVKGEYESPADLVETIMRDPLSLKHPVEGMIAMGEDTFGLGLVMDPAHDSITLMPNKMLKEEAQSALDGDVISGMEQQFGEGGYL